MMGTAIPASKGPMGWTPILFSFFMGAEDSFCMGSDHSFVVSTYWAGKHFV
jgi:hypothetical protein